MASSDRTIVLGAGPTGRAVVDELVRRGERPWVVTRSGTEVPGADAHAADITDPATAKDVLAGAAVVYQCAQPAYHRWPEEFPALQASIVDGVTAAGALLVVVENTYAYPPATTPLHEGMPLTATTRKGRVRARLWQDLEAAHQAGQIRAVAARASDFYGPHVLGSAFGERWWKALLAGKPVDVLGDPDAVHTVTYVPDLGTAMVRLADSPDSWGRAWHVPNAPSVTQAALVALASELAGVRPRTRRVRSWQLGLLGVVVPEVRELQEMAYEFDRDFQVDHRAYAARFDDHATPLREGLAATLAWWRSR